MAETINPSVLSENCKHLPYYTMVYVGFLMKNYDSKELSFCSDCGYVMKYTLNNEFTGIVEAKCARCGCKKKMSEKEKSEWIALVKQKTKGR